jgi:EmrB/QacA subfamily drug resistance transporter
LTLTEQKLPRGRIVLATGGVMLSLLLAALDQTIVGTAMPRIVAELQGLSYYAWVTTAYLVTSTVLVPIAGKLGDMFGRKPFLIAGMVGFVAASALCGLSQNMFELVLFRGIQGLFGGVLFASVFAVLADIFPIEQRARMSGLFGAVFGISSVIGPTIGGYLTDGPGWRWVFYVNVPIGVVAVLLVVLGLPYVRSQAHLRDIDWLGAGALAAGIVPLLVALSITNDHAWTSPEVMTLLGVSLVSLVGFFIWEQRARNPIVPFSLFRTNVFAVSVVVSFFTGVAMFGTILFVPLVYQGVLAVSATNSGQLVTPMMLGMVASSTLVGIVMVRIPRYRYLGTAGVALMMIGLALLAQITTSSSALEVTRDIIIIGVGLGVTFPLTIAVVQAALPRQIAGVATAQVQFFRNLGATIGSAVLGTFLARDLPFRSQARISALNLPSQFKLPQGQGGNSPQALFNPANLAHIRASLPPQAWPTFDHVIASTRMGLADSLHYLFLIAMVIVSVALVATLFLREVPLRSRNEPAVEVQPETAEARLTA